MKKTLSVSIRTNVPNDGGVMIYNGCVYRVISKEYIPDGEDEVDEEEIFEHYEVVADDITETEEGQGLLAEEAAKREAERAARARLKALIKYAKENGVEAAGIMPKGKDIINTFDICGSGEKLIVTDTEIWYVINNGMDGDDWSRNKILTGGAGAYGWKAPVTKEVEALIAL